jgi:hypothetical protein
LIKRYIEGYADVRTVQKEPELLWMADELLKKDVRSLLSIGLLDCGTEWHIARIYRERNCSIDMTGIDITDSPILQETIIDIILIWKQSFTFLHGSSNSSTISSQLGRYDAVWIDGDHSYQCAKKDFELALTVANKMIALHDIVDSDYHRKQRCFVSRLWSEIKSGDYRTSELAEDDWAGIGIVYLK